MTPFPAEFADGMNSVFVPVAAFATVVRSGKCTVDCVDVEYSWRESLRTFWKSKSSSAVRVSNIPWIWGSVSTESVILKVVMMLHLKDREMMSVRAG